MNDIPEGYLKNGKGHLVPIDQVHDIDLLRNDVVLSIATGFMVKHQALLLFKEKVSSTIATFVEISAEDYGLKIGGKKGNLNLMSFDGAFKITVQISDCIIFDERLQVAKSLIDECIHDWSDGADDKLVTLVNDSFQVDKQGNVSKSKILGLRRLKYDDIKWQQAMSAIADSITIVGSKAYTRAYERVGSTDQWKAIPLDFAALEVE